MAKQGEINYLDNLGAGGREHAFNKPFSDTNCGQYLLDLGTIMKLMPRAPAKVLDLGIGSGWTSCFFALNGYTVVGQDISPDMISLAEDNRSRYSVQSRLDLIVSDYESLPANEDFDVALFYDCLHHCEDELQALKAVCKALKPGGLLITAEPGIGHSKSPASVEAMLKYGVNERDMPPQLIVETGIRAGFTAYRVFKRSFTPESPYDTKQLLRLLLGAIKIRFLAMNIHSSYMNDSNFVVLVK